MEPFRDINFKEMSIDQIINEELVGKWLKLYKIELIEYPKTKYHPDIWKVYWKINSEIGKFNFNYLPDTRSKGIRWTKSQLESMKIEEFEFQITCVIIQDYEDWSKGADASFDLKDFPEQTFNVSLYDELELR